MKIRLILLSVLMLLTACRETEVNTAPRQTSASKEDAVKQATPKMGPPVDVAVVKEQEVVGVNEWLAMEILIKSGVDNALLKVQLAPEGELLLDVDHGVYEFHIQDANPIKIPVKAQAHRAGKYYVNIMLELTLENGQALSKVTAIPIEVGGLSQRADQKPSPDVQVDKATGEPVISMPAEETTSVLE